MTFPPPPLIRVHDRLAHQIGADVLRRLQAAPDSVDPLRDALVRVFAHYVELLIERLNRVPQMHQLAFFDCLGVSASAPAPAAAPLLFSPAGGSGPDPVVRRHTQVAAPAAAGDSEPVVFETTADLPLVRARLERVVALGGRPQQAAIIDELAAPAGLARPMLAGAVPVERAVHVSQPQVLGAPGLTRLRVQLEVDQGGAVPPDTVAEWGIAAEGVFIALAPQSDTTHGLSRTGELVFNDLPAWPEQGIAGIASRWLTCRLRPAAGPAAPAALPPRAGHIGRLCLAGSARLEPLPPERAFHGAALLDTSRDFFPLGERPRFGEVMYVQSGAFAIPRARVGVNIRLTNPVGAADAPIPPVTLEGKPSVLWEAFTGRGWTALAADDGTRALTGDGQVRLTMPDDVIATRVNGLDGGWLRVRLASGSYLAGPEPAGVAALPALAPPSIALITVGAAIEYGPAPATLAVLEHSFQYTVLQGAAAQAFTPFPAPEVGGAALYLGLAAAENALPGRSLHFFASPADSGERRLIGDLSARSARTARWQVRGRGGWRDCVVRDGTDDMRASGIIEVALGDDVSDWPESTLTPPGPAPEPGRHWYWLRVAWDAADRIEPPPLRHLGLNAVGALQQVTLEFELLGSGDGRPGQHLRTARAPVIGEFMLEVGVPVVPARHATVGADRMDWFIMPDTAAGLPPPATSWENWSRVDDFAGSGPDDRHFMLDRLAGTVTFGDGVNGRMPAPGANNIRVRRYQTGGGTRGNVAAGAISQLRTTIPYVESVTNIAPSAGGRDTDSPEALRQSAAAWLRHRDRAIARDDYADLARKASPEVARAACVAAADLAADPLGLGTTAGMVGVVIVPHDVHERPQPASGLLLQVKQFLAARCPLGVGLVVSGPLYAAFGIEAEIAVSPGWARADVVARCEQALRRFLHPLTGGTDGAGWDFGERPHASDFHPLLGAVDGVDHIRTLRLRTSEDLPGLLASGAFLACSGVHAIRAATLGPAGAPE